jgi:predicted RNA binding protein YcfA (HicA-like mRNA interferase family)
MGRLAGFTYKDVVARLKRVGFEFDRQAKGSHEIWRNPETGLRVTITNHPGDIPEGTLRAIVKATGLSVDEVPILISIAARVVGCGGATATRTRARPTYTWRNSKRLISTANYRKSGYGLE